MHALIHNYTPIVYIYTLEHIPFLSKEGHPLKVQKQAVNQRLAGSPPAPINLLFPYFEPSRRRHRAELSSLPAAGVVLDLVWPSLLRLSAHHHRQLVASGVPPNSGRGIWMCSRSCSLPRMRHACHLCVVPLPLGTGTVGQSGSPPKCGLL